MSPTISRKPYPESAIPTDDWPFFYMVERAYPFTYMIALGIILLLSYFFVRRTIGFSDPIDRSYLPFFFLGSGFMLVETKAITELGLHLGGTWVVIAAAIMLVLVMAYLANLIVTRTQIKLAGPAYAGLFLSLLVGYGFAISHGQWMFGPPLMQLALSCVVLTIPLFFAGIIFSSLISEARINISTAFAYNLMGALFGGVMEYNSMYFGFAFLYLLALGFYVLAWAFSWKSAAPFGRGIQQPAEHLVGGQRRSSRRAHHPSTLMLEVVGTLRYCPPTDPRPAAIDDQRRAGHQRGRVAGQEHHGAHQVLDGAEAAELDLGQHAVAERGVLEERLCQRRLDEGRARSC